MRERVINVGKPALVGVISEPANLDPSLPAVLLLNSGVMHQIGSCRLSVKLARAAAKEAGLLACRFDLSGIGDSLPRRTTGKFGQFSVDEVTEVMDYLEKNFQIKNFVLYGLCSGAYLSFNTAQLDSRVKGIVQIDGYVYETFKQKLIHYFPRLFSLSKWINLITRASSIIGNKAATLSEEERAENEYMQTPEFDHIPPKEDVTAGLKKLCRLQSSYVFDLYS